MAKIIFIQDNFLNESIGVMCLSSYLKKNNHQTKLCVLSQYKNIKEVLDEINSFKPNLIGFSVMTPQADYYEYITEIIKPKVDSKIIWGGAHPTFMPDNVCSIRGVDFICIGEGEEALLELMNCIEKRSDYSNIPSLWVKNQEKWKRNDVGFLENDLDKYPFPDRDLLYSQSPLLQRFALKRFMIGRGCPYNCNYCFEPAFKKIYEQKGVFVRRHSTDYIMDEIEYVLKKYPDAKNIHFSDDSINLDKSWFYIFLEEYKKRVNIPFTCNIAVPLVNKEMIVRMKYSGCHGVIVGLETGVESYRLDTLNKKVKNEQYLTLAKLLKEQKIKLVTNNMFCLPNESIDDAIETLRFNKKLKIFGFRPFILKVYKGTNLAEYVVKNKLYSSESKYVYVPKDGHNHFKHMEHMLWLGYFLIKVPFLINIAGFLLTNRYVKFFKFFGIFSYWADIRLFKMPLIQSWKFFRFAPKIFYDGIAKKQK